MARMLQRFRFIREYRLLRFPPSLEMEFQREYARRNLGMTRVETFIGILMFGACGILDVIVGDEYQSVLLTLRFLVIVPVLLLLAMLSFRPGFRHYLPASLALAGFVVTAGLSWMIVVAHEEVGSIYFFGIVLINTYVQGIARAQFRTTLWIVVVNTLIFNAMMFSAEVTRQFDYLVITNFFIVMAAIIGGASAYRVEKLERNEYLQNRNLSDRNRELQRDSLTDALTGLPNRRSLDEQMMEVVRRSQYDNRGFSVALVDLDHFKRINDTYGHDCGDQVLKRTALNLRRFLRNEDILGRWGGEEFLIVFPNTKAPGARLASMKLKTAIAALQIRHGNTKINVTATFGIAEGAVGEPVENIIRRADAALYEGKAQGRNTVVVDAQMHSDAVVDRVQEA